MMELSKFCGLVCRNTKLFFKDKGVFLPSLIAPLILLFLFMAFLGDVYRDSIRSIMGDFPVSDRLVEGIAGGWLLSSLLSVCAVTIAFTANTVMVQDRVGGVRRDLETAPVPSAVLALSYFVSCYLATAAVCLIAFAAGLVYLAAVGWYLSLSGVLWALLDTLLLVFFGTAFSSVICHFIRSQGGIVAVEAIVSAAYGFLCGAYMPLSSIAGWLSDILMCLPGTYGAGLLHLHLMGPAVSAGLKEGLPAAMVTGILEGFDCHLFFFGNPVPVWASYLVLAGASLALVGLYVFLVGKRRLKNC